MKTGTGHTGKKSRVKKILLWTGVTLFVIIITGAVFLYFNLNRLLTEALIKSFNSSHISDVYELKFEKLSVNPFKGDVSVHNVQLRQRENEAHNYSYINSSLRLNTQKMMLKSVDLVTLLRENRLDLEKIEITEPAVEFKIDDKVPVFFPFKDVAANAAAPKSKKKFIESFFLKEFDMIDASFHVINSAREREFNIQKISISLDDIMIDQLPGKNIIAYRNLGFSIGELTGNLEKKAIRQIRFKDFKLNIDSLNIVQTPDTSIYHFADFSTDLKELDIQTADSLFRLAVQSFSLSYKEKSIKLSGVIFNPNVSDAVIQSRYRYQHTRFAATIDTLLLNNVDFDSLIYGQKIYVDEMVLEKVKASIFKDNTKPVDKNRVPVYLGQQIKAISFPVWIKRVRATGVNLVNTERKLDGQLAKANINRGTVTVKNLTNLLPDTLLHLRADAYIENRAHIHLDLAFSFTAPQFGMWGQIERFALADLNPLIKSYTPAKILKGTADEISFSGTIYRTHSAGTMKFLYHGLEVDLALKNKAKWKSSVLAFAANTVVNEANPASENHPARIVSYHADRDMNKGFVNIMIKSVLAGLKETIIMSKENRKAYKKAKKKFRKEK